MQRWLILVILAMVLVGCREAPASPAPIAYGTIVGYTDPVTGKYDTIIVLYDKPITPSGPINVTGRAHEGERVGIMERRPDGNVRIRTNTYEQGWTRIEALTDISAKG